MELKGKALKNMRKCSFSILKLSGFFSVCFIPLVKDINFDHCLGGILQLLLTELIGC